MNYSHFKKFDYFFSNQDGLVTREDIMMEIAFDQNNDGMISDEEATFYLSGHENYDQETFLSTGWLLMKHLFSKYESGNKDDTIEDIDPEIDEDQDVKDPLDESGDDDYDYDEFDDEKKHELDEDLEAPAAVDEDTAPVSDEADEKPKSQYAPEVQALVDSANVARDEYNAANNAYNDLNYDIQVYFPYN